MRCHLAAACCARMGEGQPAPILQGCMPHESVECVFVWKSLCLSIGLVIAAAFLQEPASGAGRLKTAGSSHVRGWLFTHKSKPNQAGEVAAGGKGKPARQAFQGAARPVPCACAPMPCCAPALCPRAVKHLPDLLRTCTAAKSSNISPNMPAPTSAMSSGEGTSATNCKAVGRQRDAGIINLQR